MKENNSNFESIGIDNKNKIIKSYKPYVFSMGDSIKNIRNLMIQMSRIPLAKRESNDCKRF